MNTPFKATLLRCDSGHYEATLPNDYRTFEGTHCSRCGERLHLAKTVTIYPANPQPARAAS